MQEYDKLKSMYLKLQSDNRELVQQIQALKDAPPQVVTVEKVVQAPVVHEIIKEIEVPKEVIKEVVKEKIVNIPIIEYKDRIIEKPVEVIKKVDKIVNIPIIEYRDKIIKVPVDREVIKREVVEKIIVDNDRIKELETQLKYYHDINLGLVHRASELEHEVSQLKAQIKSIQHQEPKEPRNHSLEIQLRDALATIDRMAKGVVNA